MAALDILIVGAGLVGLATSIGLRRKGHHVCVIESASNLQVIGDAIAVGANQQRVFDHYGILKEFQTRAVKDLGHMYHRRYDTGEIISTRDVRIHEAEYGYAAFILSRAGYQQFLYEQAERLGVTFRFGSRVQSVEAKVRRPIVVLANGSRLEADIIVGADGVKSAVRQSSFPDTEITSQWNCYRATVDLGILEHDLDLESFLDGINFHMGPNLLIISSIMADIGVLSLNMYCQDQIGSAGAWKAPGDLTQMRKTFGCFSPYIQKVLEFVKECVVWKVVEVQPMDSWVSSDGNIVLVGDAAHAMTPHQGQGCSTGVEDGAVLAECLSRATSVQDVPGLLERYQEMRKPRAELIQATSALLGKIWSMPDGEQQRQRDEKMRLKPIHSADGWDGQPIDILPSGLMDKNYSPWLNGHDAINFAKRMLDDIDRTT